MDPRPVKKQRRLTVCSSDSEPEAPTGTDNLEGELPDDATGSSNLHPGPYSDPTSRTKPSRLPNRKRPSPSVSPKKQMHGKAPSGSTSSKSLHNFFQPASEEQRWSSQKFEAKTLDPVNDVGDDDDVIEDDYDSYDELFTKHFSGRTSPLVGEKPRQARRPLSRASDTSRKMTNPNSFLMSSSSRRLSQIPETKLDDRPWPQRFPPSNLDELAVHKKKLADVRSWLEDAFTGKNRCRLLVLRGPAGSGKTTTISLLSKYLGFDILEWKNPSASDFGERGYTSVGSQFEEFLGRGNTFGGLDLDSTGDNERDGSHRVGSPHRRILLIEEFPTILSRTSSSLAAFRFSFQQYLATTGLSQSNRIGHDLAQMSSPIVIIVSETHLNSASSALDNLTVHRLLGSEISNHPGTTIIDFNTIAPTFMHKALKLVLEKESRHSGRSKVPGQPVLKTISEIGDIRSAISSLEFLCVKGDGTGAWGGNLPSRDKRSPRDNGGLTSMEKESLKMITQREASLGLFHAVGKIVYNKRDDPTLVPDAVQLPLPPDHLRHHSRRKISQVAVNELVDETGTDIQTFISALHENYVLSCNGPSFVDTLNDCIDALSDSDIQCVDGRGLPGSRPGARMRTNNFNAGVDKLRQHEMSYQVAARGLLFALPHPVKRSLPHTNGRSHRGDAHKMLFPNSIRLWHESEEIDELVDLWATRLLSPSTRANPYSGSGHGVRWKGTRAADDGYNDTPVTMLSRGETLLHQLPYLTKIMRNDVESRDLERVTGFNDVTHGDNDTGSFSMDRRFSHSLTQRKHSANTGVEGGEGKLMLSDDDIED